LRQANQEPGGLGAETLAGQHLGAPRGEVPHSRTLVFPEHSHRVHGRRPPHRPP
jgi:hypothetical protein